MAVDKGIKVKKGVVVDQYLQTSVNDVYAAGDVAECARSPLKLELIEPLDKTKPPIPFDDE